MQGRGVAMAPKQTMSKKVAEQTRKATMATKLCMRLFEKLKEQKDSNKELRRENLKVRKDKSKFQCKSMKAMIKVLRMQSHNYIRTYQGPMFDLDREVAHPGQRKEFERIIDLHIKMLRPPKQNNDAATQTCIRIGHPLDRLPKPPTPSEEQDGVAPTLPEAMYIEQWTAEL